MHEQPVIDPNQVEIPVMALQDLLTIAAEGLATRNAGWFIKLNKRLARELMCFLAFAAEYHPEGEVRRHALLEAHRFRKLAEERNDASG